MPEIKIYDEATVTRILGVASRLSGLPIPADKPPPFISVPQALLDSYQDMDSVRRSTGGTKVGALYQPLPNGPQVWYGPHADEALIAYELTRWLQHVANPQDPDAFRDQRLPEFVRRKYYDWSQSPQP